MKTTRLGAVAACCLIGALAAGRADGSLWGTDASAYLTGSRSSPPADGVYATGGWDDGGFTISWDVNQLNGLWEYEYTLDAKAVSHFNLEVTPGVPFTAYEGTSEPLEGPKTFEVGDPGEPGLPNDFYGVKFDYGGEDGATYTLVTDREPVWGVFYAKDGKVGGEDVYAYANALNFSDYRTNGDLSITDFIVRPDADDGAIGVIPEPATAAVWTGLLVAGGAVWRRRRR